MRRLLTSKGFCVCTEHMVGSGTSPEADGFIDERQVFCLSFFMRLFCFGDVEMTLYNLTMKVNRL